MLAKPFDFFFCSQPHGGKARVHVSDDLNGSRSVDVDRVERDENGVFWAIIGDKRMSLEYKHLEVKGGLYASPPVVDPLFDSFDVPVSDGLSNIDYNTDLRQNDSFMAEFTTGKVVDTIIEGADYIVRGANARRTQGKTYPNDVWMSRVEIVGKLAQIMQCIETANYSKAKNLLGECSQAVDQFDAELKKVTG